MSNTIKNIATTCAQSQRLITAGLRNETADMKYCIKGQEKLKLCVLDNEDDSWTDFSLPAWSLSRLVNMMPSIVPDHKKGNEPYHSELIKDKSGYMLTVRRHESNCYCGTRIEQDPIECYVSTIEWLIKNNHFNRKYLKQTKS